MKRALIIGITGQDSYYLAELLLTKGYEVHGIKRYTTPLLSERIHISYQAAWPIHACFNLHYADSTDVSTITRLLKEIQPDEIYNLGAMSRINTPFETSEHATEVDRLGTLRLLEAVRTMNLVDKVRIYHSAMPVSYKVAGKTANLEHEIQKPYFVAATKPTSHEIMTQYRTKYRMYACNGVLFNCEYPRRTETLLSYKITQGATRTALGLQGILYLDALETRQDWGQAQDYAEAIWRVLQQDAPNDFVIATGIITTVREFVRLVFAELAIDVVFQGEGAREVGYVVACHNPNFALMPGQTVVAINPSNYQTSAVEPYLALAEMSKTRRQLGWKPHCNLHTLVQEIVAHDLQLFCQEISLIEAGHHLLLHPN